jgi:hypothetical protein
MTACDRHRAPARALSSVLAAATWLLAASTPARADDGVPSTGGRVGDGLPPAGTRAGDGGPPAGVRVGDNLPPAIASVDASVDGAPRPGHGLWQVQVGVRTALLRDAGYDPFSSNDAFTQLSVSALRALRAGRGFATALGLAWDDGSTEAVARGTIARLSLRRPALVFEERFAPVSWAYAFARVSPGWLRGTASLGDASLPVPLTTSLSTLEIDGSLGAAVGATPHGSAVSFWLLSDAGYGWAPAQGLALTPNLAAADRGKAGTTHLADLAARGVFFRFSLALVY